MPRAVKLSKALRGMSDRKKPGVWKNRVVKSNPGITKLQIAALEYEYAQEKPPPSTLEDWVEAKAFAHSIPVQEVRKTVEAMLSEFDDSVRVASYEHAQVVSRALGATRAKVLKVLAEALDAKTDTYAKVDGEVQIVGSNPDYRTQLKAVEIFQSMYGFGMPSKMEVQHDIGDNLSRLGQQELELRHAELQTKLAIIEGKTTLQLPPPTIDAEIIEPEKEKRGQKRSGKSTGKK